MKPADWEVGILNSKGFGGNNATAVLLSPGRTERMLEKRHGADAMAKSRDKRAASDTKAKEYFAHADLGEYAPIYRFGEGMIADEDIEMDREQIRIKGLANPINLPVDNPYPDMS